MTGYESYKTLKNLLDARVSHFEDILNSFPKNEIGLISDKERNTEKYTNAKNGFNRAFAELRKFNGDKGNKKFHVMQQKERRAKRYAN